jgi:hypothetical protein
MVTYEFIENTSRELIDREIPTHNKPVEKEIERNI